MKKFLSVLLSVLIVGALSVSFASCNNNPTDEASTTNTTAETEFVPTANIDVENNIIGTWTADVNLSGLAAYISLGEGVSDYLNFDNVDKVPCTMTFDKDGGVVITADSKAVSYAASGIANAVVDAVFTSEKEKIEISSASLDDFLANNECSTMDEYYDKVEDKYFPVARNTVMDMVPESSILSYKIGNGLIYFYPVGTEFSEETAFAASFELENQYNNLYIMVTDSNNTNVSLSMVFSKK